MVEALQKHEIIENIEKLLFSEIAVQNPDVKEMASSFIKTYGEKIQNIENTNFVSNKQM